MSEKIPEGGYPARVADLEFQLADIHERFGDYAYHKGYLGPEDVKALRARVEVAERQLAYTVEDLTVAFNGATARAERAETGATKAVEAVRVACAATAEAKVERDEARALLATSRVLPEPTTPAGKLLFAACVRYHVETLADAIRLVDRMSTPETAGRSGP